MADDVVSKIEAIEASKREALEAGAMVGKVGVAVSETALEVGAGDAGDFTAAATGTTVTGKKLTPKERAIATVLAVVPLVAASQLRSAERLAEAAQEQRILRSGEMRTLNLSGDWRATKFARDQQGIVYVLKDAETGELLKVGKSEVSNFTDRFRFYEKAAHDTGRRLDVDVMTVPKDPSRTVQSVEQEIRSHLEAQGHALPWDQTSRRLGRPGPGVPGTPPSRRLRNEGYGWSGEQLVKDPKE